MIQINIVNDQTGTDESANYKYTISVNGAEIDHGVVTGHNRAHDWKMLVNRLLYGSLTEDEREYQFRYHILRCWESDRISRFIERLLPNSCDKPIENDGGDMSLDQTANKTAIAIADYLNSLDVLQPLAYYMARGLPEKLADVCITCDSCGRYHSIFTGCAMDKSNVPTLGGTTEDEKAMPNSCDKVTIE